MNKKMNEAIEAAAKIRVMENEVGEKVKDFIYDLNALREICRRSGMRSAYLKDLGEVALGKRKRHMEGPRQEDNKGTA